MPLLLLSLLTDTSGLDRRPRLELYDLAEFGFAFPDDFPSGGALSLKSDVDEFAGERFARLIALEVGLNREDRRCKFCQGLLLVSAPEDSHRRVRAILRRERLRRLEFLGP